MPRYYFDLREGDELIPDDEGVELYTLKAVQEEAARSLADMAREAVRRQTDGGLHPMGIEVRDESGLVLHVRFTYEVEHHQ